ncbi:MAG TPA: FAD-dependent oxidoreductase [Ramlibacter sp.]|jgi:predicted NAD/FAD-binding protein|uniref:NAD(P)/FAD-dependent oxidoreductase n=1 Tax=Ramlibacter sp. TaxID=1917967 RepID=UPI002D61F611|nr:FAD-dependent oxidoreductase [Ramlibacter sp.]HZY17125.1 FAD-dependent oxidoreductase [Ramlibacter sp.]
MKVAIVGSGIAGLAAAHQLRGQAQVTLFEAGAWFGGHTHTVDVTLEGSGGPQTCGVDTGFLVFNERTYPQLIRLLAELGVPTSRSDMSFSVQVPGAAAGRPLEWSGSSLATVFAQRTNLLRPGFWRMLRDLLRFNALTTRIAREGTEAQLLQPLGDFLRLHRFSAEFRDWYFLPMIGCIWSCPTDQMLQFPVGTMIRFCHNHGLLQVANRPQWWTVAGGARQYVERILAGIDDKRLSSPVRWVQREGAGVRVCSDRGWESFDRLVVATHPGQALAMLLDATEDERNVLGAIRYQPNRAVLHTDTSVLPQRRAAWAAWNYEGAGPGRASARVCLHYLLNRLQPVPWSQPVIVSLNPVRDIAPARILGEYEYAHPVFDLEAIHAQALVPQLQGRQHTYFCGAWTGYGFHEDGLKSGLAAARQLQADLRATSTGARPAQEALA